MRGVLGRLAAPKLHYNKHMPPTLKDVARLSGCSIKTVSRVVNHEPHVSEATRSRVLAAVRATGYTPNLAARRLVQQKSYAVCILVYPGFSQPASALLTRLLDLAYEENYDLLLQTYYPTFPASRRKLAELAAGRRFDGFVSTPPCDADGFVADLLGTYKLPLVQINPLNREGPGPYLAGDDELGARLAVEHLLQLGHRRVACLRGPRNLRSAADRLAGYQAALAAAGLALDPALVQDSEFTFDGGYTAARLLAQLPQPPSAIYAASDEAALGVLFAAQELGLSVPGRLSICGHDDLPTSRQVWPRLTTVHQPAEELLEHAVRLLIDLLKGTPLAPGAACQVLPPGLVVRGSTGVRSESRE
jgi:LacI family transcriptional regulator